MRFTEGLIIILSRITVTKTRVWIGESVYWIFTTDNCNTFMIIVIMTRTLSLHMSSIHFSYKHSALVSKLP
jgi:hypothetical protein